jgi:hypothetical protein
MPPEREQQFDPVVAGRQLVLARRHWVGVRYDLKEGESLVGRLTDVSTGPFRSGLHAVRAEAADGTWHLRRVTKKKSWWELEARKVDEGARKVDEGIPVLALRPPLGMRGLDGPVTVEFHDRELELIREQRHGHRIGRSPVPWELRDRGRSLMRFMPRYVKEAIRIETLDAARDEPALSLFVLTLGCALLIRGKVATGVA